MPERPSVARALDRGKFARPAPERRQIFSGAFEPVLFEPYAVGSFGISLWHVVYFKGGRLP